MKLAILSENCYSHIDFDLIPLLDKNIKVGWFPFFNYQVTDRTYENFVKRKIFIKVEKFKTLRLKKRMRCFNTFIELNKFVKDIKKWNPDLIYVNADAFPWLPIILDLSFNSSKIIAAIHDVSAHGGTSLITHFYKRLLPHFYTRLNMYSEYSFNMLKMSVNKSKIVTWCPHPLTDYGKVERKNKLKTVFIFFGSFFYYKGLDILLEAGTMAYEKNNNILIKICGTGSINNFEKYKNHPAFLIVNRYIEDFEIPELFSDVDCLVLPYRNATQSGPMMIALNYCIPVLASDILPFKYFEHRFSEINLIDNTVESWVKNLCSFQKCSNLENYEREIGNYKREIAERWNELFEEK